MPGRITGITISDELLLDGAARGEALLRTHGGGDLMSITVLATFPHAYFPGQ